MGRSLDRLAASVIDGILADIAAGRLSPGDPLAPEAALAERFSVSKPVVREAMARLSVQGIVAIRRGLQTVVQPLSGDAMAELFGTLARAYGIAPGEFSALRRAIEIEVAGLAAARASAEEVAELIEAVDLMASEIRTIDPWVEADLLFHHRLAAIAGQRLLAHLLQALEASTRETMRNAKLKRDLATTQRALRCHIDLAEAVRAHDPDRARALMVAHFEIVADLDGR